MKKCIALASKSSSANFQKGMVHTSKLQFNLNLQVLQVRILIANA